MGRRPHAAALLLALVTLTLSARCSIAAPSAPMNKIPFLPEGDPWAERDAFAEASAEMRAALWREAGDVGRPVEELLVDVAGYEEIVHVRVVLVGMDGDAEPMVDVDTRVLASFLGTLAASALDTANSTFVRSRVEFTLAKAAPSLVGELNSRVARAVAAVGDSDVVAIAPEVVDDAIAAAHGAMPGSGAGYTVYLLNLENPRSGGRMYGYDSASGCLAPLHVSDRARYVWFDFGAGPAEYGPAQSGEGIVTWYTIPRLDAVENSRLLLADLAGLVWAAVKHLVLPPVAGTAADAEHVQIKFVVVGDESMASEQARMAVGTRLASVFSYVSSFALPGQVVTSATTFVEIETCPACQYALAAGRKTFLTALEDDVYRSDTMVFHHYLDSAALFEFVDTQTALFSFTDAESVEHEAAAREAAAAAAARRGHGRRPGHHPEDDAAQRPHGTDATDASRVIPVVLFHVSEAEMMIDLEHLAVAGPSAVVAVSNAGVYYSPFACVRPDDAAASVNIDSGSPYVAISAALMSAVFSIAPTHTAVSQARNRHVDTNYLFSLGGTPFGPFAVAPVGSFALSDAVYRHAVYAHIESALGTLTSLFTHFSKFGKELSQVLPRHRVEAFVLRWAVVRYKLGRITTASSLNAWDEALYFARSLKHDVNALHSAVHDAGRAIHTHVRCAHDPSRANLERTQMWSTCATVVLWIAVIVSKAREAMLRRNADEQLMLDLSRPRPRL